MNATQVPVVPPLGRQERLDFIKRVWQDMPWEQRIQPKYAMSSPYWDGALMAEHAARQTSVVEPLGRAWFMSKDKGHSDRTSGEPEEEEVVGLSDMQWAATLLGSIHWKRMKRHSLGRHKNSIATVSSSGSTMHPTRFYASR